MAALVDFYPQSLLKRHGLPSSPVHNISAVGNESTRIDWVPDAELFEERAAKLSSQLERGSEQLPKDWPTQLKGSLAWTGGELKDEEYIYTLSHAEVREVERAIHDITVSVVDLDDIGKENFRLPTLGSVLEQLSNELHNKRGFFVLRGLDPASYSREENVILYLGITSYIAEKRARQNLTGNKLVHITNVDVPGTVEKRRPIYSNAAQPFHADVFCNVLALYHLNTSSEGGDNLMASSWKVYNELAATRPDIIQLLARDDWAHDTFGLNPTYTQRPLLFHHDNKIILNFSRRVLTGAPVSPRSPEIPTLSEAQAEAIDAVHFCALKHSLKTRLGTGDMLFVNNLSVLHSRTAFQDDETNKRHVLRLWLNNPARSWQIPPGLELEWARLFEPLDEVEDHYDVDPFTSPDKISRLFGTTSSKCG